MTGISRKKVRCLGLSLIFSYLKTKGVPPGDLLKGLPYTEKHFKNVVNWIDTSTFLEIENRVKKLFPDEHELFFKIGLTVSRTKSFGFIRTIANLSGSPHGIYTLLEKLVPKHLFRFVSIRIVEKGENEIYLEYEFDGEIENYMNFIETVRGILTAIPEFFGLSMAKVSYELKGNSAIYHVRFFSKVSVIKKIRSFLKLRGEVLQEAAKQLEEANNNLLAKMEELERTHDRLKKTYSRVELLNELTRLLIIRRNKNSLLKSFVEFVGSNTKVNNIMVILSRSHEDEQLTLPYYCSGYYDSHARKFVSLDYVVDTEIFAPAINKDEAIGIINEKKLKALKDWDVVYKHVFEMERCLCVIPLEYSNKKLGYLLIGIPYPSTFNEEERRFLKSMVNILSICLNNALIYEEFETLNRNLTLEVDRKTKELKSLNIALQKEIEEKEKFDRLKEDFLIHIGHELKTPLMLILSPVELLLMDIDNIDRDEIIKTLGYVKENATRLARLVRRLLDYARLEAGKASFEFYDINLNSLINECVDEARKLARDRRIKINYSPAQKRYTAHGNKELLGSAVSNIIENSIKYSPDGSSIDVTVESEGQFLKLTIEDRGMGIAPDELENIFKPFSRGKKAEKKTKGWGLGLPLSNSVLQKHGGKIKVSSKEGKGTKFAIYLPTKSGGLICDENTKEITTGEVKEEASEHGIHQHTSIPAPPIKESVIDGEYQSILGEIPRGKYKILLVEDDEGLREFLNWTLSKFFKVYTAKNGAEAFNLLEKITPDIIIADVMMKPIDGFAMCELVRSNEKFSNVPIILLTAMEGKGSVVQGLLKGANDYIKKPFSMEELLVRIKVQIEKVETTKKLILNEKIASLGMLMAGISHEIKNPINAIINSIAPMEQSLEKISSAISKDELTGEIEGIKPLLDVVKTSSERILELIQGIGRYVSVPDFDTREVKIEEIIDTTIKILRHKIKDKIKIKKNYRFNRTIRGSPGRLSQVFLNIIDNAISSIKGEGVISIETMTEGQNLMVRISDTGSGIPASLEDRIFDPFFTTKEIGIGVGLGLSICKEIVQQHKGSIEVDSTPGKGTNFKIYLPVNGRICISR